MACVHGDEECLSGMALWAFYVVVIFVMEMRGFRRADVVFTRVFGGVALCVFSWDVFFACLCVGFVATLFEVLLFLNTNTFGLNTSRPLEVDQVADVGTSVSLKGPAFFFNEKMVGLKPPGFFWFHG